MSYNYFFPPYWSTGICTRANGSFRTFTQSHQFWLRLTFIIIAFTHAVEDTSPIQLEPLGGKWEILNLCSETTKLSGNKLQFLLFFFFMFLLGIHLPKKNRNYKKFWFVWQWISSPSPQLCIAKGGSESSRVVLKFPVLIGADGWMDGWESLISISLR